MSTVLPRHQRRPVIRCTDRNRSRLCTLGWVNRGKRRLLLRRLTQAVFFPTIKLQLLPLLLLVSCKPTHNPIFPKVIEMFSSSCKWHLTVAKNLSRIGHSSYYKTTVSDHSSERKVLAELEKETQNWAKLRQENPPQRPVESPSSSGSLAVLIVSKYIASGLSREAVPLAVANYGDNPTKVLEFAKSFTQLGEMGFASNDIAGAQIMYENDTEKAVAHFLNSSS